MAREQKKPGNIFSKAMAMVAILLAVLVYNRGGFRVEKGTQAFLAPVSSCTPLHLQTAELVLRWYDLELKFLRQKPGFAPPVVARSLGYTGIMLYESLVNGMQGYQSLAGTLHIPHLPAPGPAAINWLLAGNAALSSALKCFTGALSEANRKEIKALESYFQKKFAKQASNEQVAASVAFGRAIGAAIYEWSKTDGGHDGDRSNYDKDLMGPLPPGRWQASSFSGALLPHWGNNRPFLAANVAACQPPRPPVYSDEKHSALFKEAMGVYAVFQTLTSEQSQIARYWADAPGGTFTPAGHSAQILCQVISKKHLPLDSAAVAFAKLGIALNDAFISCWKAKYNYNFVRPITYIRKNIRKDWWPFLTTPSFPEYPSGHSVQAGAAAEVLSNLFGEDCSFADTSNDTLGYVPRQFYSFHGYAKEVAISRLYGGIHFPFSVEAGLRQGKKIGSNVNAIRFRKR